MQKIITTLAIVVMAAGPAVASEETDVLVPVHQFVDGFNKGDSQTALAACADETSIIDEFPPHEWHGAGHVRIGRKIMKPTPRRTESLMESSLSTDPVISISQRIVLM